MTGKMTSTVAGDELIEYFDNLNIADYPHAKLDQKMSNGKKKDGTRMLKLECASCGYVIRTTKKWIEVGLPVCHCGTQFEYDVNDVNINPEEDSD